MKWLLPCLLCVACYSPAEPECRPEMPPMRLTSYQDGCGWGDDVRLGDYECGYGARTKEPGACTYQESFFCTMGVTATSSLSGLEYEGHARQSTQIRDRANGCVVEYTLEER